MTEKKALTLEEVLSTAKTGQEIHDSIGCPWTKEEVKRAKNELVSLGLVQRTFFEKERSLRKRTGKQWAGFFYEELGYRIVEDGETEFALKEAMGKILDEIFSAGFSEKDSGKGEEK